MVVLSTADVELNTEFSISSEPAFTTGAIVSFGSQLACVPKSTLHEFVSVPAVVL